MGVQNGLQYTYDFAVLKLHEQAPAGVTSKSASFATQHFTTSVLSREQRDEYKPLLPMYKEDKTSQVHI